MDRGFVEMSGMPRNTAEDRLGAEMSIGETEILDVMRALERGEITIPQAEKDAAQGQYCGIAVFHLSNGWEVAIFDDCDEWDYIEWIKTPDGREVDFDTIWDTMPTLRDYAPPRDDIWGIGP